MTENEMTKLAEFILRELTTKFPSPQEAQYEKFLCVTDVAKICGDKSTEWVYSYWRKGTFIGYRLPGTRKLFFKLSQIMSSYQPVSFKYLQNDSENLPF